MGLPALYRRLSVFILTGIEEVFGKEGITVSPNSTSGLAAIAINCPLNADYAVEVYDNVGQLVQSLNKRRTEADFEIDLGKFSAGL